MLDICADFGKNCLVRTLRTKSFLKKPLVALSLLVLITMCLSLAEAAPRPVEQRRRHAHRAPRTLPHRAPARAAAAAAAAAPSPRTARIRSAILIITKRLRNTERYFKQHLKDFRHGRKHKNGKPAWLPRLNFVNLHKLQNETLDVRFRNWVPKLYKHLKQYQALFKQLKKVELKNKDSFVFEMSQRHELLDRTSNRLGSAITALTDIMDNFTIPTFKVHTMNLNTLQMQVDATQCEFQDDIAYRGYQNLLNNWLLEFKCLKKVANNKLRERCEQLYKRYQTNKTAHRIMS